jgi:hypothetical protein
MKPCLASNSNGDSTFHSPDTSSQGEQRHPTSAVAWAPSRAHHRGARLRHALPRPALPASPCGCPPLARPPPPADASLSAESLLRSSCATTERLSSATRAGIPSLALYASEEERDELDGARPAPRAVLAPCRCRRLCCDGAAAGPHRGAAMGLALAHRPPSPPARCAVLEIDDSDDDEEDSSSSEEEEEEERQAARQGQQQPAAPQGRARAAQQQQQQQQQQQYQGGMRLRLHARRAAASDGSDTDGSDQDHSSALGQPVAAAASQQRRAAWQAAAAADTGCSSLPSLPVLRNQKGPVIIVQNSGSGELKAGGGPILRPIGALPSGAQVSGPIQVAPLNPSALSGSVKLQPVTLRPVMLVPAKGAAALAGSSPGSAGSSHERGAFAEQLRAPAERAERGAGEQQQEQAAAQPQRHGGSSRQRQSKLSAKQAAAKREAEQAHGSPKGAKRARGQGPARIAAAPAGHCCSQCGTQTTPVWRAGPQGPKTLCNACGVRYMKTAKKK